MKKIILAVVLCFIGLSMVGCQDDGLPRIGIVQFGRHASLDEINDSIIAKLEELGYVNKTSCHIYQYSADFDVSIMPSINSALKSKKVDVVVAIATPTAQSVSSYFKNIPIIFSAVSDPLGAGLVDNLLAPTGNVTGTSDVIQIDKIIEKARLINPGLNKIGFIYNASEDNSVTNKAKLELICANLGIEMISRTIAKSDDIATVANILLPQVDAIVVTDDNTVAEGMYTLAQKGIQANKPIYVGADSMIKDGGFLTVGINYTQLGAETAIMVDQVLSGIEISQIPVKFFNENLKIYINENTLQAIGITLPQAILEDPDLVYIRDAAAS